MDFKTLLEPYAERDETGHPKRTIEGQIKWLMQKAIPRNIIDQALLKVYNELETGLVFQDDETPAGHKLDHYLLTSAQELQHAELAQQAKELETFLSTFKQTAVEEYIRAQKGSVWKRVKAVFRP